MSGLMEEVKMAQSLTMIVNIVIAGILLFLAIDVNAATIYGTIYRNNQPLQNTELQLDCLERPIRTDMRGTYRVTIEHLGRCKLSIGNASGIVIFYQDPTRYDFDVDGTQLRRR
jgi:hypothetical protein